MGLSLMALPHFTPPSIADWQWDLGSLGGLGRQGKGAQPLHPPLPTCPIPWVLHFFLTAVTSILFFHVLFVTFFWPCKSTMTSIFPFCKFIWLLIRKPFLNTVCAEWHVRLLNTMWSGLLCLFQSSHSQQTSGLSERVAKMQISGPSPLFGRFRWETWGLPFGITAW